MKAIAGCRQYTSLLEVTEGELGSQYIYVEFTNDGSADVLLYPNDFTSQGHSPGSGIPIKAGTTREIPMAIMNFTSSGPVTVVAYGQ